MKTLASLGLLACVLAFAAGAEGARKIKTAIELPVPKQMTPDQRSVHALNRMAFGPRPGDVESVSRAGIDRWIEQQLYPEQIVESTSLEGKLQPLDTLHMEPAELARQYARPAKGAAIADGRDPVPNGSQLPRHGGPRQVALQLMEGKILRAAYSNRQLEAVLTDFWYNHFNVFLDKGADRYLVTAYERDVIRPHVLGHFKNLLLATAQSPAMLFYLDNWQSVRQDTPTRPGAKRRGLNENYGRELMELHTMGVDGGYTERDVTEVARCFTGWTIRNPRAGGEFQFNPRFHDRGEKSVLGVTIPAGGGVEDGRKVIDILSSQPATAAFISRQLAVRFVSDDPSKALIQKMAKTFSATDGDLREVMRTMFRSPEFWAATNFRSKIKSPFEMVVSALRATDASVDYASVLATQLNQLGEPLFRKAEPTGYSNRSENWMNSAALLGRMNFAAALAANRLPGVAVDAGRWSGKAAEVERSLLNMNPAADTSVAIDGGLQSANPGAARGALIAGLVLGSPDFQRR